MIGLFGADRNLRLMTEKSHPYVRRGSRISEATMGFLIGTIDNRIDSMGFKSQLIQHSGIIDYTSLKISETHQLKNKYIAAIIQPNWLRFLSRKNEVCPLAFLNF